MFQPIALASMQDSMAKKKVSYIRRSGFLRLEIIQIVYGGTEKAATTQ